MADAAKLLLWLEDSLNDDGESTDDEQRLVASVEFALDECGYRDIEAAQVTAKCRWLNYDPETRS